MLMEITTTLFGILTTVRTADVVLTLHKEKMTWSDARAVCLQDGGTLIPENSQNNISDFMANVSTPVWEGRYYSQLAWLLGCYSYQGSIDYNEIKDNQMKECVNHCHYTNYFGLRNKKCFCFDNFKGSSLRTIDNCKYACPGNEDETCGGDNAITMYMNDICYKTSSKWQGTVSQTASGKQCLPWTSIAEVNSTDVIHFPDGNVGNASNFCRDPFNQSKPMCHISQDKQEVCNIPPCIEAANGGIHLCMSFKKPRYGEFEFMQESCQSKNYAFCTSDYLYFWRFAKGTWQYARHQSRQYYKRSPLQTSQCKSLTGPNIFLIHRHDDVHFFHWFGYFREVCTDSTTVPNRMPQQCFSLSKENDNVTSRVEDCDNKNAFICQYVHTPTWPTTTKITTTLTQSSDTSIIEEQSGDGARGNFALSGGALTGLIIGPMLCIVIVFGIALFINRRRKTSKPEEIKMNSAPGLNNDGTDITPRLLDNSIRDTGETSASELYQNTAYTATATAVIEHVTAGEVSMCYLRTDDNESYDSNAEHKSEVYNTLTQYQNLAENVYSCLNSPQV